MNKPKLTLWHDLEHDGDTSLKVIEQLCSSFSEADIIPVAMSMQELQARLSAISNGGQAAEIAFVPADLISLRDQARLSVLPAESIALVGSDFAKGMQIDGVDVGVPLLQGNQLVCFYNRLVISDPPTNWEDLRQRAPQLMAEGITPLAIDAADPYWLVPFLTAHGGWPLKDGKPNLDTGECQDALQFLSSELDMGVLGNQSAATSMLVEFVAGRTAMMIGGEWVSSYLLKKLGNAVGVTLLPTIAGRPMLSMVSNVGFIFPGNALDGPHRSVLRDFIVHVLSPMSQGLWITEVQRWPINDAAIRTHAASAHKNSRAILAQLKNYPLIPINATMFDTWYAMGLGLERLIDKRAEPIEAAAFMQVCAEQSIGRRMTRLPLQNQ